MSFRLSVYARHERREKAAWGRGWNEDLIPVYKCRISLVLHALHHAHDFPGRFVAQGELATQRFPWRSESSRKSLIDDSNLRTRTHFGVCEFATEPDLSAHCLEILRQHGNHRRIAFSWNAIQPEWSSHKSRSVKRKKLRGTGAANAGKGTDTCENLLKVRKALSSLISSAV